MGADNDVYARHLPGHLLVHQVARVAKGDDDVHPLCSKAGHLLGQGLNLVVQHQAGRHVGRDEGVRGEVTYKPNLPTTLLHHMGGFVETLKLRTIPEKLGFPVQLLLSPGHVRDDQGTGEVLKEGNETVLSIVKLMVAEGHGVEVEHGVHLGMRRQAGLTCATMDHLNLVYHMVPWKKSPPLIQSTASLPWASSTPTTPHLVLRLHLGDSGGHPGHSAVALVRFLVLVRARRGVFVGLLHPVTYHIT